MADVNEDVEDAGAEAEREVVDVTEKDESELEAAFSVDSDGEAVGEAGVALSFLVVAADVVLAAVEVLGGAEVFGSAEVFSGSSEVFFDSFGFAVGVALFFGVSTWVSPSFLSAVFAGRGLSMVVLGALSGSSFLLSSTLWVGRSTPPGVPIIHVAYSTKDNR